MELFMKDISFSATKHQVIREIAQVLHSPAYARDSALPLNFHIRLFFDKNKRSHTGKGTLTLPTIQLGKQFLRDYGNLGLRVCGRFIKFSESKKSAKPDVVETILRLPYQDPSILEEKEYRDRQTQAGLISIQKLQFGWECRDNVFSSEFEYDFGGNLHNFSSFQSFSTCQLTLDAENREIRLKLRAMCGISVIAIRFAQIHWYSAHQSIQKRSIIFFSLYTPPSYEYEPGSVSRVKRQRQISLDPNHTVVVPYTSLAIRLVCNDPKAVSEFRRLCRLAQLQDTSDEDFPLVRRNIFSSGILDNFQEWLRYLDYRVAFQLEALVRRLIVDPKEMLSLRPKLDLLIRKKAADYTSSLLRHFAVRVGELFYEEGEETSQTIEQCFDTAQKEYEILARTQTQKRDMADGIFQCFHAHVTPTTMLLEGPFPERSNRVIRAYPDRHDFFLRVSFIDEDRLQYRFDRDVDGPAFTRLRVGSILSEGLTVAGRFFRFLAYSQSALKEHAVWFVSEFFDPRTHKLVNASTIIHSLGNFNNLEFDKKLQYCPARYGARVSQAFTSTDPSISVEAEEIFNKDDIKSPDGKWCFTDGVGTISPELAREIWQKQQARKRARRSKFHPRAFQVRFMGSKGMLSVDYKLPSREICLRPSMIKFEAPESREIEIAQAFDRPRKYYLNRPLIMILEHIGISYETFKSFQDISVKDAQESKKSLGRAAKLLESHGLGNSFRLSSVMLSLEKLGVELWGDPFYKEMMEYAIHHVLRELKHRARIPIPGAWTLVGVADEHKFLEEDEIFACVKPLESPWSEAIYLEGPILISRSPTIHPGDVQIVHAIGKPPPDSCFQREPLPNTVVFSVKGTRPMPSRLGGGDLDGDEYNLIPLNTLPAFKPKKIYPAGAYTPAPRKILDRPSTMEDVADFFVDYINSDVLGIIAINWMIIADQSRVFGLDDPDCLTLAQLHSDAVDYPKSGQPVSLDSIPKLKFSVKPDWYAPETTDKSSPNFYESQRAIGRLFRDIHLHDLGKSKRTRKRRGRQETLEDSLEAMDLNDSARSDAVRIAVETRVSEFIDIDTVVDAESTQAALQLYNRYTLELQTICDSHTLFPNRFSMLSEAEALTGTIVAKCSQPRMRRHRMARMRELTNDLVHKVRDELDGDGESLYGALERAWVAWILSLAKGDDFGAKSFGWVALGAVFEGLKEIEEAARGR